MKTSCTYAVREIGADRGPETGAFIVCDPQPQDVFDAVHIHAYGHVAGLVDDPVAVADFHSQRVEEDHWVELIELSVLPDQHLIQHRVSDRADRIRRSSQPRVWWRGDAGCHARSSRRRRAR